MNKIQIAIANIKTTLASILPIIGSLALAFGWIDLEQQTAIIDGVNVVLDNSSNMINEFVGIISAVSGIGLLFAKDSDKSSKALGI